MLCPAYPVTDYRLVLESPDNEAVHYPSVSGDLVKFVIEGLREDSVYNFYIEAENQFGNSSGFMPVRICELCSFYHSTCNHSTYHNSDH